MNDLQRARFIREVFTGVLGVAKERPGIVDMSETHTREEPCGTVACVAGWIGAWRAAGGFIKTEKCSFTESADWYLGLMGFPLNNDGEDNIKGDEYSKWMTDTGYWPYYITKDTPYAPFSGGGHYGRETNIIKICKMHIDFANKLEARELAKIGESVESRPALRSVA